MDSYSEGGIYKEVCEMFEYIDALNRPYDIYIENFEYPVVSHWHHYAEVLYMLEGRVTVDFDQYSIELKPNELLFIYPKSIHGLHNDHPGTIPKYAVLKFDLNELNLSRVHTPWLRNIFLNIQQSGEHLNHFTADQLSNYPIHDQVMNCVEEIERQRFGYEVNVSANLNMLLVNLIRIWQAAGVSLSSERIDPVEDAMAIDNIIEFIDNHSNEMLSVTELAARCNMSYSNFARLFKKMYGRSCKEYVEYIRVIKAHDMLVYTNFPLNYISSETGFYDCSHFIRTYKKIMGITPNQQRKQSSLQM